MSVEWPILDDEGSNSVDETHKSTPKVIKSRERQERGVEVVKLAPEWGSGVAMVGVTSFFACLWVDQF